MVYMDVKKCTTHIKNAPTVDKTSGRDYDTGPLNKSQNRSCQGARATRLRVPTITAGTALHKVPSARQQLRPHNESEDVVSA